MAIAPPSDPAIEDRAVKTVGPARPPRHARSPAGPWAAIVLLTGVGLTAVADGGVQLAKEPGCPTRH